MQHCHTSTQPRFLFARHTTTLALALAATGWATVYAQSLPQAGRFNPGDLSSGAPKALQAQQEAQPISPALPKDVNTNVRVKVTSFRFSGNNTLAAGELNRVVADAVGQELGLEALDEVANKVARHYRVKGFMAAQASIPPQQSVDGTVEIAVLEGQYNSVVLKNASTLKEERIRKTLQQALCDEASADCKDQNIIEQRYERAALLLRDIPGSRIQLSLDRTSAPLGKTDVIVQSDSFYKQMYTLGFDNYGSVATGKTRFNMGFVNNDMTGDGDQLQLNMATTGSRSTTGSVGYTMPVGYQGTRVGFALARGQYYLGEPFDVIKAHGVSNSLSGYAFTPLIRSANRSVYVRGTIETRSQKDFIDLITSSSSKHANVARLGLTGDNLDAFGGGGYTAYSVNYSLGRVNGSDSTDSTNLRTYGGFSKIAFNVLRQQTLSGPMTLFTSLNGLRALNRNLDGSEQIGIGGPGGVRAYAGEAGGNTGAVATVELRYTTPLTSFANKDFGAPNLTYGLFADRGWVDVYRNTNPGAGYNRTTRALGGRGLSLTMQSPLYYVRAMVGMHPASEASTSEPGRTSKFWLEGNMSF